MATPPPWARSSRAWCAPSRSRWRLRRSPGRTRRSRSTQPAQRSKYLLSPMHLAGYALDPEFIDDEMSGEVQEALITVSERLLLCSEMRKLVQAGSHAAARALT
eukprot:4342160-Prymnesium_polylepis.1